MNILYLCNKNPYPERDGGCVCMNNSIREAIRRDFNVKVLAVNSFKNYVKFDDLPQDYREATQYESVYLDLKVKPIPFVLTYFSGKSPHIIRFESKQFSQALQKILNKNTYDCIILESLFMCPYIETIRSITKTPIVLRAHNVEHKIWERTHDNEETKGVKGFFKKFALKHVYKTLRKYELEKIKEVDGIAAITSVDAEFFKENTKVPVKVIPAGFKINANCDYCTEITPEPNTLFHLGAMNWLPNIEGLEWFLDNVWNLVLRKHPGTTLHLAGRQMSDEWKNRNIPNVVMVGEVDHAFEFMCSKKIMVVPLLSGSGMRIKIVEGMTLGKAIVTTTIGAEGLEVTSGKDIMIADNAQDFADKISLLLEDPELYNDISKGALQAAKKYNIVDIYDDFVNFMKQL